MSKRVKIKEDVTDPSRVKFHVQAGSYVSNVYECDLFEYGMGSVIGMSLGVDFVVEGSYHHGRRFELDKNSDLYAEHMPTRVVKI